MKIGIGYSPFGVLSEVDGNRETNLESFAGMLV